MAKTKTTRARLTDAENKRRHKVYKSTSNDVEAAKALGISRPAFYMWRKREKLPARSPRNGKAKKAHRAKKAHKAPKAKRQVATLAA